MTPAQRAAELVALINDGTPYVATADTRSVHPPCFLFTPPIRTYDLACGFTATWKLYAIAAPPATLDAWQQLDGMADQAAELFDVETIEPVTWPMPGDPAPAYLITFTESMDS